MSTQYIFWEINRVYTSEKPCAAMRDFIQLNTLEPPNLN